MLLQKCFALFLKSELIRVYSRLDVHSGTMNRVWMFVVPPLGGAELWTASRCS